MAQKDFVTIRGFNAAEIRQLSDLAVDILARPSEHSEALKGKAPANIFEKPLLRTRVTFELRNRIRREAERPCA